ncbi:hypothetical protein J6590_055728 [Homalodisca vitripennis]|nr:hypothetical protein J6590_055728 [Homalodisca vitripennis]
MDHTAGRKTNPEPVSGTPIYMRLFSPGDTSRQAGAGHGGSLFSRTADPPRGARESREDLSHKDRREVPEDNELSTRGHRDRSSALSPFSTPSLGRPTLSHFHPNLKLMMLTKSARLLLSASGRLSGLPGTLG